LPVGSGNPDILVASWRPEIAALSGAEQTVADIIAYLRGTSCARETTIAGRLRQPRRRVQRHLSDLVAAGILASHADTFQLQSPWRDILPEIITIEVKVNNWRGALAQAARNCILAHRSLVAMPARIAPKLLDQPLTASLGIGVLAIADDESVTLIRRPRRTSPTVWQYYYKIAIALASDISRNSLALRYLH
jgi:hypothetical protein